MTELILIRHGRTALNRGPFFQGQIDVPLDDVGHAQARRLAERLARERPDALACSDLLRARQTAGPASTALGLVPTAEPALREQAFGAFEGLSFEEVAERYPQAFVAWQRHVADDAVPGGESVACFHARTLGALRELAARHAGRRVAVVTHGGVLDMVWRTAHGLPLSGARQCAIPNAGLNRVAVDAHGLRILAWADDDHVADLGPAAGAARPQGPGTSAEMPSPSAP